MKKLKRIPVNIWDDFYDDDCVPKGEIQQTHAYVEDHDIPEELREKMISKVFDFIKTLDLKGVNVSLEGTDIVFEHLTHQRLSKLIKELEDAKLTYESVLYDFYSES